MIKSNNKIIAIKFLKKHKISKIIKCQWSKNTNNSTEMKFIKSHS